MDFFDLKLDLQSARIPTGRLQFEAAFHPALHPGALRPDHAWSPGGEQVRWAGLASCIHDFTSPLDLNARVQMSEVVARAAAATRAIVFKPVSKYPPSIRDIAIVVDCIGSGGCD